MKYESRLYHPQARAIGKELNVMTAAMNGISEIAPLPARIFVPLNGASASYIFMGVALFASVWLTLIVKPANEKSIPTGARYAWILTREKS